MFFFIQPLRALIDALKSNDSPRQIAFGVALGMAIGLVPKGNLLSAALLVMLFSLRVNHGAALSSAFVFTWIGLLLDPLADWLGEAVLTMKSLEPLFITMYDAPLIPWTSFNNTVVLGSLILASVGFYPLYLATRQFVARHGEQVVERLQKYRAFQVLCGADLATRWKIQ